MRLNSRFTRFAVAMGVVGVISSQIPLAGGVAMAQDYDPDGGGGGSGLVQGLVLGLVGLGIYTTLTDKTPAAPPPDVPLGGGGGAAPIAAAPLASIFDVASGNPDLTSFATNADKVGLADDLKKNGPYTTFAPTNAAFASLPGDTLATLQQEANRDKLKALLQYHIVQGKYTMADLRALASGTQLPTLAGSPITVTQQTGNVLVNGVQVIDSDIPAANGIIHPLGQVLTPPAPVTPPAP